MAAGRITTLVKKVIICAGGLFILLVALNIPVTTLQGVNYRVRAISIPFYIKAIEFFDRDYHYRRIVKEATAGCPDALSKMFALLRWTGDNLQRQPEGLAVVDDHVHSIIIRGYGTPDQFCDVFSTLCNYAGIDSFFSLVCAGGVSYRLPLSFVKLGDKWRIVDPYAGVVFMNNSQQLASIEEAVIGDWQVRHIFTKAGPERNYRGYLSNLRPPSAGECLQRSSIQSPLRRLLFAVKKALRL